MNMYLKSGLLILMILLNGCELNSESEDLQHGGNGDLAHSKTVKEIADETTQSTRVEERNLEIGVSRQNAITETVRMASPAIVGINVTEVVKVAYRDPFDSFFDDPFFRRFFGDRNRTRTREYQVQGLGSGFIISPDGYILTNHHVAGNASKVIITMTDGKKYDARIIGSDYVTDVALLKIDGENLPYLKLGNSDNLIVGEWTIAFGNPFGLFDINAKPTVTVGVVSNTDVNFMHEENNRSRVYRGMIQTDAAISSGNSGGPLLNANGEVIGMNTVIFSTAQSGRGAGSIGIGFSIPINRVKQVVDVLKQNNKIDRNFYVGIEVVELDKELADYLGTDLDEGVVIRGILRKSPAEKAGLEPGDIILEIDGEPIHRTEDYYIIVNDGIAGQKLNFLILRDGKKANASVKLSPR